MIDKKIRAIVVDDEDLARQMLQEYLVEFPNIEIVGECDSGEQAVKTINSLQPDLIFLDVQMPELSGFGVLKKLEKIPFVIFSTAYDKYALQAFEVNAVDYLLKPYDRERFNQAVQRVLERMENNAPSNEQIQSLINSIEMDKVDTKRLWIKENGSLMPIKLQKIDWIEAMDDYACLHVGKATHLVNQTMRELEAKLDDKMFMRIHRSTIVNLDSIQELRPLGAGNYQVVLKDRTKLSLSRGQAKKLKELAI